MLHVKMLGNAPMSERSLTPVDMTVGSVHSCLPGLPGFSWHSEAPWMSRAAKFRAKN